jgi:siroheme decarboxylase
LCELLLTATTAIVKKKFKYPTGNLILFFMRDRIYMMKKLTLEQKKIARLIQRDIVVTQFPFKDIAGLCELTEEEILRATKQLRKDGYVRKFGAILRHQKAGYKENALVVWAVPQGQTQKTGNAFASFSFVSHCYEREPAFMKKYNLFTMIHSGEKNISALINEMVNATEIKDYLILESVQEYKKTSPEYFE